MLRTQRSNQSKSRTSDGESRVVYALSKPNVPGCVSFVQTTLSRSPAIPL